MTLQSKYQFRVPFWVPLIFFPENIILNLFQKKKTPQLSLNIQFSALDFVFFTNFTNIEVCHIFICGSIREYSVTVKIFSSQSMISRLSNALSNASIALLVLEKFTFEVVKLTQQSPFQSVFICVFRFLSCVLDSYVDEEWL